MFARRQLRVLVNTMINILTVDCTETVSYPFEFCLVEVTN
jgi:hypothetical protein